MTPTDLTTTEPMRIFDRALIMKLEIGRPGNERKLTAAQFQTAADKTRVRAQKKLISSDEYKAIASRDNECRAALRAISLPSPLGAGAYLVPFENVTQADEIVETFKADRAGLIDKLRAVRSLRIEEAKLALSTTFNAADYPSDEAYFGQFYVGTSFLAFGLPPQLEGVDKKIWQREQQKLEAQVRAGAEEIVQLMRWSAKEIFDWLADKLTPGEDGKTKMLRKTALDGVTEFLRNFEARNITDDKDLARIIGETRRLVAGVTVPQLKASTDVRDFVRKGLDRVREQLEPLVTVKPKRMFLDEEAA